MNIFVQKLKCILVVLLLLGSSAFANTQTGLFNSLVANKQSYNSNLTQIEFLVLMGRLLNTTNDLAPQKFVTPLTGIPKWAETEVNYVQNKFGQLSPYYFESFNASSSISKQTVVKFLNAYLDLNNSNLQLNTESSFNVSFYRPEKGYETLIGLNILSNTSRSTLSKLEVTNALIRASEIKNNQISFNQNNKKSNQRNVSVTQDYSFTDTNLLEKNKSTFTQPVSNSAPIYDTQPVTVMNNNVEIKGNAGMSNLYIWRGMSQANSGDSAIYGALDTLINTNFTLGTFVSNVGFSDQTSYELDLYASYSNSIKELNNLDYTLGYIYYAYPDSQSSESINFSELYLGLSKNNISFTYYMLVNGPNKAKLGNDSYFNLSYAKGIIQDFEFISSVGYYTGQTMVDGNQTDFMIGLTKKGFTLSALATNTTIKQPRMQIKYELDIF